MKKLTITVLALAALSYGFCQYFTKTGEYIPAGYTDYKVCQYGQWSLNIGRFEMCPYSIQVDTYTGRMCY
jgi:hypothetical protein